MLFPLRVVFNHFVLGKSTIVHTHMNRVLDHQKFTYFKENYHGRPGNVARHRQNSKYNMLIVY